MKLSAIDLNLANPRRNMLIIPLINEAFVSHGKSKTLLTQSCFQEEMYLGYEAAPLVIVARVSHEV